MSNVHKIIKKYLQEHIIKKLKFGQKEVTTKDFYVQRQITNLLIINVNKAVVSDKVSCNNGNNCLHIIVYQVDGELIRLFFKTAKDIFDYGVWQYDKNSAYTMSFNFSEEEAWKTKYKKIWNETSWGKLKTCKECIKTNFHGQDVPNNMYCNATGVLKIDSVYKQGKNYHPQVYVKECKCTDAENQQCSMLSNDDDDGFLEV